MSDIKLKPCPFCGGRAKLYVTWDMEKVMCTRCKCQTPEYKRNGLNDGFMDGRKVVKKWNTRKPMERIVEKLKNNECDEIQGGLDIPISKAIEIVQKGGAE